MMHKIDDCSELRDLLQNATVLTDGDKYKKVVRRVVSLMNHGYDMGSLLPDMIKALACSDLVVKKLVYYYISVYAFNQPDLTLLAVNTLVKQCFQPNPMLRAWALKTLCSLRLVSLCEYIQLQLQCSLQDSSPYVRAVGALCCAKVHQLDPNIISDLNLDEVLLNLTQDKDPSVTVNSMLSLDELHSVGGGFEIHQTLAHQLLNRLSSFSESGLSYILQFIERYTPSDDDEIFNMLNILDPYLNASNPAVVMIVSRLFLKLTQHIDDVHNDVYRQIYMRILSLCDISTNSPELQYLLLCHLRLLIKNNRKLINTNTIKYSQFFTKFKEPFYIKEVKLDLLTLCCNDDNITEIVEELCIYSTDSNTSLSTQSITALSNIAISSTLTSDIQLCINKLIELLNTSIDYIISTTLTVLQVLLLTYPTYSTQMIDNLQSIPYTNLNTRGRGAFLWILGQYGQGIEWCVYTIEDIIDNILTDTDTDTERERDIRSVISPLLTATMKQFIHSAPLSQPMLSRLLQYILQEGKDNDMCVRSQALFYYQLLNMSVSKASKVLMMSDNDNNTSVDNSSSQNNSTTTIHKSFNNTSFLLCGVREGSTVSTTYNTESTISTFINIYSLHFNNEQNSHCGGDNDEWSGLVLLENFHLTPQQFESYWSSWPTSTHTEDLDSLTNPTQLTSKLSDLSTLHSIYTMAVSPTDSEPWKAYLYTKDLEDCVYLFELLVNSSVSNCCCECTIKSDSPHSVRHRNTQWISTKLSQVLS